MECTRNSRWQDDGTVNRGRHGNTAAWSEYAGMNEQTRNRELDYIIGAAERDESGRNRAVSKAAVWLSRERDFVRNQLL